MFIPSNNHPSQLDLDLNPILEFAAQETREGVEQEARPKKQAGQKRGAKGWTKQEIDCLLQVIDKILPCGSKQWDHVSLQLSNGGFHTQDREACKHKFERLWSKEKPTGTAKIPLHIKRAKDIKEKIMSVECMGHSAHNDSDEDGEGGGL